jgi:hypothetical protein
MSEFVSIRVTGKLSVYRIAPEIDTYLLPDQLDEAVRSGDAVLTRCQSNLIVNQGLQVFSRQLGGNVGAPTIGGSGFASISDIVVSQMLLGALASPPAPSPTDTALITPLYSFSSLGLTPTLVVTYPTDYSIQFGALLPSTEGNGTTWTQEQLVLTNGLLFAETIYSEPKASSFGLQFLHSFSFGLV